MSWYNWVSPVGGAVYDMFKGDDGGEAIQPRNDYPYMAAGDLYGWASDYRKKYPYDPAKPYEGKLSAPMGQNEMTAQNQLSQYQSSPTSTSLPAADKYTTNVMEGGYDPRTSPYYTAMKEQITRDAQEQQGNILHQSAQSGMLHSDPRRIQERKLAETTSGQLANVLGSMYEAERGRMGQAAGMAPGIAEAQETLPIKRIAAGSTYGAIPRTVAQGDLDRQYGEYKRQVAGAGEPYRILENLSGRTYDPYGAQPYAVGGSSGGGMDLSQLVNMAMMFL